MNVLQVLPELKSGGVERGAVDLAKFLQRGGHRAVVVSAGGPLANEITAAGGKHYTLPVHKKSLFSIWYAIQSLSKIVAQEKIDIIHARSRVPALIAFFVSRRTQVPFITTCHGFYSKHFLSAVMGWGKLVIVASHIIGRRMRDDFGVPHDRIRLIPRGVNLEEFFFREPAATRSETLTIGLVGRITPIKGHPLFLKAMSRVARIHPNIKIQIIGDAPKLQYKEELMLLARRLGLAPSIEFLGTRYDIPELLSKMDILVVPSVGEEGFGRVIIEAGAIGVPVVATRIGGIVDIVEHENNGLLVPADDPRLLADAVVRLIEDPELAKQLATNLRQKVEKEFGLDLMFKNTIAVYEEAITKKKILIIKLSALGDVILSIPSIRAVREKYPNAFISVLVGRRSRKIVRNCPYVDDVIVYEDAGKLKRPPSLLKTARILAKQDYDISIDLQNNRLSRLLAYFGGARLRVGHRNRKWSFLLNRRTANGNSVDIAPLEHQYQVLELLDIKPENKKLELWTDTVEDKRMDAFFESQWLGKHQLLVGINPGSSPRWPTKQWPIENFAKLCDELARRNIRVVVTGAREDLPLVERLLELTKHKPINAVGKTSITELVSLIRRCDAFITSDSAPMHIASALDIPLVALFGPTDPKRHFAPPTHYELIWKEVSCSPCYLRSCPVGHICMKKITLTEVQDAVWAFLKDRRASERSRPRVEALL